MLDKLNPGKHANVSSQLTGNSYSPATFSRRDERSRAEEKQK